MRSEPTPPGTTSFPPPLNCTEPGLEQNGPGVMGPVLAVTVFTLMVPAAVDDDEAPPVERFGHPAESETIRQHAAGRIPSARKEERCTKLLSRRHPPSFQPVGPRMDEL